jgi:general secretion pathway protein D
VAGLYFSSRVNCTLLALALAGCETAKDNDAVLHQSQAPPTQIMTYKAARSSSPGGAITNGNTRDDAFDGLEQQGTGRFIQDTIKSAPASQKAAVGAEGITLNLLNVPVAQAAKTILGDVLKVNYTVADRVGGTITIQTASPMHKDSVVQVFESALRINGAALVHSDGHYRIVPAANAPQSGAHLSTVRESGPGSQVRVITLRHVAPTEMRRIIEPISPRSSVLIADDSRNLLVVSGNEREIADMDRTMGLFDVDWMRGMSVAFYPVKSSDPEAIGKELETVLGLDKDGPLKGTVRVIPNRRLNAIMVISSQPGPLDAARKWIKQLDRVAETSEEQLFVYKIRNRGAGELAGLLSKVLVSKENGGQASASGGVGPRYDAGTVSSDTFNGSPGGNSQNGPAPADGAAPNNGLPPGFAGVRSASLASPTTASPGGSVPPSSSGGGFGTSSFGANGGTSGFSQANAPSQNGNGRGGQKIVADEANSSLLITATRREYDRILQILDRMDILPTQVMLEAMIAEVTLTDEIKFGVNWAIQNKRHETAFTNQSSIPIAPTLPGFSYFYLTRSISAALDAVSSITKVNVISAPSLMVLDNRRATLQIGDQVPIVTQSAQSTLVAGGPVINSVALKDTGIILNVTPHVSDSGRVVLEIEQEVSNVSKTTSSGIDSPTIQQRSIKSSATSQLSVPLSGTKPTALTGPSC